VILYRLLPNGNSILNVVAMNDSDKITFFEKYIVKLKAADEIKRVLEEKQNKNKKT
jgi:hypothetical protein